MAQGPKLDFFFVYNPVFDRSEETEHEKLLYFWPPDTPQDEKMKTVGLAEALVKYSATFAKEKPCEVLHTQKTRQVFLNPEPNFWVSFAVSLPASQRSKKDEVNAEYHGENVQNIVLQSLLQQTYNMYRLFNGTFTSVLDEFNREALVHKLDLFFSHYIHTLDYANSDVVEAFNGIQFLPLDKNTYLKVQCFVNHTESAFPAIRNTVFAYHDHLVWSGLEQEDMRVLYRYLTASHRGANGALGAGIERGDSAGAAAGADSSAQVGASHGTSRRIGFATGPEDLNDPETPINAPRLYVDGQDGEELHLVMYNCNEIKLCLLVDGSAYMDLEFYKKLNDFIERPLQDLDHIISEQQSKRSTSQSDVQYKYLYFNHMNLAQKSSFMTLPKKIGVPTVSTVSPEYIQYLTDMHTDFTVSPEESEIILKTEGDCWVVGRQSDQRQFFVILNQKNANLIEINDEIRRLSSTHFGNIFMVD